MRHVLWDAGGEDRVDLSQLPADTSGYRVDIRPGGWITTTTAFNSVNYGGSNFVTNFGTRIALAGSAIENVTGSRSNDTIFLNASANRVSGYTPGTSAGNDVIQGAGQADVLDLSAFARSAVTESQVGDNLVLNLGSAGTITVSGHFAAAAADRMRIEYQPDASVRITSDRPALLTENFRPRRFPVGAFLCALRSRPNASPLRRSALPSQLA
jgi:serralysin